MFEKIKNTFYSAAVALKNGLLRIYAALAFMYICAIVIATIALSIIFPPIAPLAIMAGIGLVALGIAGHFFVSHALNSVFKIMSGNQQQPVTQAQAQPAPQSSSTQQIQRGLNNTRTHSANRTTDVVQAAAVNESIPTATATPVVGSSFFSAQRLPRAEAILSPTSTTLTHTG
jgi:hypothetical protein